VGILVIINCVLQNIVFVAANDSVNGPPHGSKDKDAAAPNDGVTPIAGIIGVSFLLTTVIVKLCFDATNLAQYKSDEQAAL
jgi:hypothetical protein